MPTLFEQILAREIPAELVYEDEQCGAFRDIMPQAPVHVLVVPRRPIPSLAHLTPEDEALVGHLFVVAARVAADLGLDGGFRTVVNTGDDAGQTVPHLHVHLMGGRRLGWPPG